MNKELLLDLAQAKMPFGKYKGQLLVQIPESYYIWMKNKSGFPEGKLGMQMAMMYEIKVNGLEELIYTIRKKEGM